MLDEMAEVGFLQWGSQSPEVRKKRCFGEFCKVSVIAFCNDLQSQVVDLLAARYPNHTGWLFLPAVFSLRG